MKNKILLFVFSVCSLISAQQKKTDLVVNNQSKYKIIISSAASAVDSTAAAELQKYIEEISGNKIPILSDDTPIAQKEIVVGRNKHSEEIDCSAIVDNDGFLIKSIGEKIYFIGGAGKGSINAVFTFLDKYLGCRMYSTEVKIIPKQNSISIPPINDVENPAFAYRDVHFFESTNDEYCRWQKLVDSHDKKTWGLFVHTFQKLLPPEKYFASHHEYYALRNGVRVPDQPCLSNPEVLKIITDELRRRMKENPEAKIWSVSQNDNFSNCQCPQCSRIDSIEGSPSGSIINFVNKIAEEFPDKIISTLAYQYSRKAPKHIKPEKNVNIMLCTIECSRTYPIETDTSSSGFLSDLKEWSKLTHNIFLWDYVVQFTNLVSPFPNFQVLQPNIQLFKKYGVRMMFQQGSGGCRESEFEELRSYLIAKLLWNPDINVDSVMNDFLSGYYGAAGKYIREYINSMQTSLLKSKMDITIYGSPVDGLKNYLSPGLIDKYNKLFDEAESSVADQPDILNRVKIARLPLIYAMLEEAKVIGQGERGIDIKEGENNFAANPKIISLLDEFGAITKNIKDIYINERGL